MTDDKPETKQKCHFEVDLRIWPIFNFLPFTFLNTVRRCMVFGSNNENALMVTNDDAVYGIGENTGGCLGTNDIAKTYKAKKVEILCNMLVKNFCWANGPHVFALAGISKVYHWGTLPQSHEDLTIPTLLEGPHESEDIVDIGCQNNLAVVVAKSGILFVYAGEDIYTFKFCSKFHLNTEIVQIACGSTWTMIVTGDNNLYGFAANKSNAVELGLQDFSAPILPRITSCYTEGKVIVKVACGHDHTLVLYDDGDVFSWGSNSNSELGHQEYKKVKVKFTTQTAESNKVPLKMKVVDIAASRTKYISLALTSTKHIYAWGWCCGHEVVTPISIDLSSLHVAFARFTNSAMYKPLVIRRVPAESYGANCVAEHFDDPATSDLSIIVEEKVINVHKCFLRMRSTYFEAMFRSCWKESDTNKLYLDAFSYNVYRAFLKYLYTDTLEIPKNELPELLELAHMCNDTTMQELCIELVERDVDEDKFIALYAKALQLNNTNYLEVCMQFALRHTASIVLTESFKGAEPYVIKAFITDVATRGGFRT